ncbi:MAG TPA: hypothetical protein VGO62_01940 [Myxococcota bacterium]|jgi:hypothetical protein
MAEITLKLRRNAATGKREIVIHLESDADALPHEHEQDHKKLVESLLGMPITEDMGEIVVERVAKEGALVGEVAPAPAPAARAAVKGKGS